MLLRSIPRYVFRHPSDIQGESLARCVRPVTNDDSAEDDADNYEVVAANIKELYKASLKRPSKAQEETKAGQGQGQGFDLRLMAKYLTPNPQDYESNDMDYAMALHKDCQKKPLHLHVINNQEVVFKGSSYNNSGPVNDLNSNNDNPFHTAATLGKGRVWATHFLRYGVRINAKNNQGNTVLHLYMLADMDNDERTAIVALILQNRPDADVNIKNRDRYSVLDLAVYANRYPLIGMLVKAGAKLDEPTFEDGNTILHYAVFIRHIASTQVLVAAGAPVDITNNYGATPLILAAKLGSKAIVNVLLDGGADIEKRDNEGLGPVEMAARENHLECLTVLVGRGANLVPPEGSKGPTAMQLAEKERNDHVVQFLLSKGC